MNKAKIFLKFVVPYYSVKGELSEYNYYGELYNSGRLKIFNPAYPIKAQSKRNFFMSTLYWKGLEVNSAGRYFCFPSEIAEMLINVGRRYELIGFEKYRRNTATAFDINIFVKRARKYEPLVSVIFGIFPRDGVLYETADGKHFRRPSKLKKD